ncbi:FtsX-like permease family protein [Paenibacillus sp. LHD-117]|uniref:FtsX-like permease family protein n=1 Tax=Paenibacillus sp. LHD-117 TaxID=3071412 RepID=UPI0027DF47BD|nr:FtsX-like permease family protein [Paenibacillus sp. LHD-117]MDQ6421354.1 FtsX-like permease family protein [Paenibacillus sp. LHD-117]
MSLLQLTLRNVRRNFRVYTIYLLAMIAGVVIHFTFSSLMYNDDILEALRNSDMFRQGVSIASVAIFLFIVLFILYANSFFMKQRKKELGMYLLLGMNEKQVTRMLFYETTVLGAVSLAAGILLGGLLSKWFGMLLMKLMQYDQTVSLSFPAQAIGTTALVFLVIVLIISIQNLVMVRRVQLVELFRARSLMEKPIRTSPALAILAVILLAQAYVLIVLGRESVIWKEHGTIALPAVSIGIIAGTWLFFRQFAGWLLSRLSKAPRYHEGNTVLWTSSLRFQVRSNALNLTFITLFSTALILLISFVAINYSVQFSAVSKNLPNDFAFETLDEVTNAKLDAIIRGSENHPVNDYRVLHALRADAVTDREIAFQGEEQFREGLLLVSESTFKQYEELRGHPEPASLIGNEAIALSAGIDIPLVHAPGQRPDFDIMAGSTPLKLSIAEQFDYSLLGWTTNFEASMTDKVAILVIADDTYSELSAGAEERTFATYDIEDAGNAEALSKQVQDVFYDAAPEGYYSSFADVYSKQIESSSLMLFSGAFLAIIALFALASVIYFRQLREATEAMQQFDTLRKLGIRRDQVKSVIRKQLLFVFAPPLALGLLSSWFIIDSYILDTLQDYPDVVAIVIGSMVLYFLIYGLLYLSSSSVYERIVSRKL